MKKLGTNSSIYYICDPATLHIAIHKFYAIDFGNFGSFIIFISFSITALNIIVIFAGSFIANSPKAQAALFDVAKNNLEGSILID